MDKEDNLSRLNVNLSKKEQKELDYLNNTSNNVNQHLLYKSNPMNLTINEFIKNWADANIKMLIDITNLIAGLSKYRKYFNDIDNSSNWLKGISKISSDFLKILTSNQRPIYIGFTFILLSFALFIIQITS